ncbi:MAG: hypothetical protein Q8L08_07435 [Candidatus Nanopelagicaceae bacterium]|nr:hypothetical protein [Candidatus Nanopelagicaceae bacterium]
MLYPAEDKSASTKSDRGVFLWQIMTDHELTEGPIQATLETALKN